MGEDGRSRLGRTNTKWLGVGVRAAALRLRLAANLLGAEPTLLGALRRCRTSAARRGWGQCANEQPPHSLPRGHPVGMLRPVLGRDDGQPTTGCPRTERLQDSLALALGQRCGPGDVELQLDSAVGGVHRLPTRPRRPGEPLDQLSRGDRYRSRYAGPARYHQVHAVHRPTPMADVLRRRRDGKDRHQERTCAKYGTDSLHAAIFAPGHRMSLFASAITRSSHTECRANGAPVGVRKMLRWRTCRRSHPATCATTRPLCWKV